MIRLTKFQRLVLDRIIRDDTYILGGISPKIAGGSSVRIETIGALRRAGFIQEFTPRQARTHVSIYLPTKSGRNWFQEKCSLSIDSDAPVL